MKKELINIMEKYIDIHFGYDREVLEKMKMGELLETLKKLLEHMDKEMWDFADRANY